MSKAQLSQDKFIIKGTIAKYKTRTPNFIHSPYRRSNLSFSG